MAYKIPRTYRKWDSMIARCHRPSHPAFSYYGARGITVCDRWRSSYLEFLADMGEAPAGLWLDRIDGSKGYEPGNCRWVTPSQSALNRRQRQPDPDSLRQQAARAGIPYSVAIQRRLRGWPVDKVLTVPVQAPGPMTHHAKDSYGLHR